MTSELLEKRIEALEKAGLSAEAERKELAELLAKEGRVVPKPIIPSLGERISFTIPVDAESFETGGEFGAPTKPDIYDGYFLEIVYPQTKEDQVWFVFATDDDRVVTQKGRNVRSALIVMPGGAFAYRLRLLLESLKEPYKLVGDEVSGSIPKGLRCKLNYQEIVVAGKTQVRLQNVFVGEVAQAI